MFRQVRDLLRLELPVRLERLQNRLTGLAEPVPRRMTEDDQLVVVLELRQGQD
jgi:hypothetical protein